MLPVLYEFPPELQRDETYWKDRKNWPQILPNLGRSIDPERLSEDYENNGKVNKEAEKIWLSQHLNIEMGVGFADEGWRGADYWEAAAVKQLADLDEVLERSEVVTFGGDGGGLDDLLAAAVIGRERKTRHWLCWTHAWANRKVIKLRADIASRLHDFEQEGSLTICNVPEDMNGFGNVFEKVMRSGLLPAKNAVALDPNNVAAMIEELSRRGMTDEMLRRVLQGPALSPAWWGIERKLDDGTFFHGGTALMNWVVGNAKVESRGNAILITKQMAGRAKIDPLIAIGCAAILMSWNPAAAMHIDLDEFLANAVMR
jgi:phage terminase large subunit-like protein